ncbi:MAG: hypothetical protein JWN86_1071 [Planctomycetota bacterium]|nr:hypothetical protein [Planctomycetota bacterium]
MKRLIRSVTVLALLLGAGRQATASLITYNASFGVTTLSSVEIDNPYFAYAAPGSVSPVPAFFSIPWAQSLANIPAGTLDMQSFLQEVPNQPSAYTQYSTLIGTYANASDPGGIGVILMFDNTVAADILLNNKSWDTLFPDFTEGDMITALQGNQTQTIVSFFTTYLADFPTWTQVGPNNYATTGTLLGFSDPTSLGTSGSTGTELRPVPEPSGLALAGIGGLIGLGGYGWSRRKVVQV